MWRAPPHPGAPRPAPGHRTVYDGPIPAAGNALPGPARPPRPARGSEEPSVPGPESEPAASPVPVSKPESSVAGCRRASLGESRTPGVRVTHKVGNTGLYPVRLR
eukprot:765523-Hanusia_phi.AAC.2